MISKGCPIDRTSKRVDTMNSVTCPGVLNSHLAPSLRRGVLKVAGIEPGMSGRLASVVPVHIRECQYLRGLSPVKGDAASGFWWDALLVTSAFINIDRRLTYHRDPAAENRDHNEEAIDLSVQSGVLFTSKWWSAKWAVDGGAKQQMSHPSHPSE